MSPIGTGSSGSTAAIPQRVFLSHTSDLGKPDEPGSFVAAAVAAVLRARHAVTDMAYFAARDAAPAAVCRDMVAQSDVYVGIMGLMYGSPVRDRPDVSYTELEFETAGERRQPRLVFLIREDSEHLPATDERAERRARQDAFRTRLLDSALMVVRVSTPAELELAVFHALVELGPAPKAPDRLVETAAELVALPTDAVHRQRQLPSRPVVAAASLVVVLAVVAATVVVTRWPGTAQPQTTIANAPSPATAPLIGGRTVARPTGTITLRIRPDQYLSATVVINGMMPVQGYPLGLFSAPCGRPAVLLTGFTDVVSNQNGTASQMMPSGKQLKRGVPAGTSLRLGVPVAPHTGRPEDAVVGLACANVQTAITQTDTPATFSIG